MKVRIGAALFGLGVAITLYGFYEWRVGSVATAEPVDVDLAKVEAGQAEENTHWKIGPHVAVYSDHVFSYRTSAFSTNRETADENTDIDYVYYPIISVNHPFLSAKPVEDFLSEEVTTYRLPELESFAVLVKTNQYKRAGKIPGGNVHQESVQGVIMNRAKKLSTEEKEFLAKDFKQMDLDNVWLLEAGRSPSSTGRSLLIIGMGAAVVVGGILIATNRSDEGA